MENRKAIVMARQTWHQKNSDTVFDFDNTGIDMYVDGDWVRMNHRADNGLGVAAQWQF
jgi:dipeptidase D